MAIYHPDTPDVLTEEQREIEEIADLYVNHRDHVYMNLLSEIYENREIYLKVLTNEVYGASLMNKIQDKYEKWKEEDEKREKE